MSPNPRHLAPMVASVLALTLAACGGKPAATPPAPAPAEPIVDTTLDLSLDPPSSAGFTVVSSSAGELVLRRAAADGRPEATLTFDVAPSQVEGVNLIDAVKAQKAAIEAKPNGAFLGQVELGSQIGRAFSTRGRYTDGGSEVEEIRLLAVHPSGDRLLAIVYRYPPVPGDTQKRIEEAMGALGLVTGRATPAPAGQG